MKWCRLCTWKCNNLSKKMLEFIIRHAFGEELIVSQIYDKFKIVNSELKSNDWQQFQRREGGREGTLENVSYTKHPVHCAK